MKYLYNLHETMRKTSSILVYEGEITQEITKSVLSMAERNMDSYGENSNIKRKVFNIMVECLQNIVKHGQSIEASETVRNNAIFMIGKQDSEYYILSGNPVFKHEIEGIIERLERINSLDKDGLKVLYKDIIKNGSLSEKGGAGLGFVDMARKSGQALDFDFEEVDSEYSFFSLKTTISRV